MKTIFRNNQKNGNFTCISNSILQSETLSPDEIGVLVRFLSLPENFVINKTSIWKTMNIGREHFHRVWNKLVAAGHIHTTKKMNTKSKHFEYSHSVYEIPIQQNTEILEPTPQEPVNQKPVSGNLVNLIIDNKKEPEEITRRNMTLSDSRTGGEGGQGQNNTGPDSVVVQFPSSIDYGKLNAEPEQKIPTEVPEQKKYQGLICESEVPEIELDENDIKEWVIALDEMFLEKYPQWFLTLKKGPLHSFIKTTKIIHQGDKELISMLSVLYDNVKQKN